MVQRKGLAISVQILTLLLLNVFQQSQAVEFYPYGLNASDSTLPRVDDGFIELNINTQFGFFGDVYEEVYISTNGIIFFGAGSREYVPSPYPLVGTRSVAAYWVDSDPREGGNIFYRETFDQNILNDLSLKVRQSFVQYGSFRSIWALITTFNNVPRYACTNCSQVVNHQTILTTDGVNSFVIFLYDKLDYSMAQIGFNAGDGKRYYATSKSITTESGIEALTSSNIGKPGEWIFSIGDEIISTCSNSSSLQVYPRRIFYTGNQELYLTGPCLTINSTVSVSFDSVVRECRVTDSYKIKCLTPYFDKLGNVAIYISNENINYENFVTTYDYKNILKVSSETESQFQNGINGFTWTCEGFDISMNNIRWFQQNIYMNGAGGFLNADEYSNVSSSNVGRPFDRNLHAGLIINFYATNEAGSTCQIISEIKRARTCQQWYDNEKSRGEINSIVERETNLNPCPARIPNSIPEIYGGFKQDPNCNTRTRGCIYNPGAKVCYRSVFNPNGISTECCYNNANTLIIGPGGGGSINMFDPSVSMTQHLLNDLYPFLLCCKWSTNCDKYYEKRPSITSRGYTPPSPPILVSGDPHFTTMDGFEYQFNPVGEFIYLQSPQTEIQCRISQYRTFPASYFSAFAVKTETEEIIQVELNSRKNLVVKMSSSSLDYGVYQFENITVNFINSSTLTIETKCGIWMKIIVMGDVLNAILTLEQKLKGKVYGLVGNWDDDIQNDLMRPDKTFIPINSTSQEIHYYYGFAWRTSEATSLFTYPSGLAWADYQNINFIPFFGTPVDNPICQGDSRCLFDLYVTNNRNLSLSNIVLKEEKEALESELISIATTCVSQMSVSNGVVSVNRYNESSFVYQLTCNSGYQASGSIDSTCISGKISNDLGSCELALDGKSSSLHTSFLMLFFTSLLCYLLF